MRWEKRGEVDRLPTIDPDSLAISFIEAFKPYLHKLSTVLPLVNVKVTTVNRKPDVYQFIPSS